MFRPAVFLCAFAAGIAGAAHADDDSSFCYISAASVSPRAPHFADFPARPWHGKPAPVAMTTPTARLFRTRLREGQAEGANFAGHYHLTIWGCGAACIDWAMTDLATGKVITSPLYRDVQHMKVDAEPIEFQNGSRLLIVRGAANEDEKREGTHYLLWTGTAFRKMAFYSWSEYCVPFFDLHTPQR